MCGIFGYCLIGEENNSKRTKNTAKHAISKMAILNMKRGTHSTGIARVGTDGSVKVFKKAKPALDVVFTSQWSSASFSAKPEHRIFIGHTRFATHGEKTDENAHPFVFPNIVGAHNGVVHFNKSLRVDDNLAVDSAQLFELFQRDNNKNHINVLEKSQGSMSTSFVYLDDPRYIYFTKISNPLTLVMDKGNNIVYWSSEKDHLLSAIGDCIDKKRTNYLEFNDSDENVMKLDVLTGEVVFEKFAKYVDTSSYMRDFDEGFNDHFRVGGFRHNSRRQLMLPEGTKSCGSTTSRTDTYTVVIGEIDEDTGTITYGSAITSVRATDKNIVDELYNQSDDKDDDKIIDSDYETLEETESDNEFTIVPFNEDKAYQILTASEDIKSYRIMSRGQCLYLAYPNNKIVDVVPNFIDTKYILNTQDYKKVIAFISEAGKNFMVENSNVLNCEDNILSDIIDAIESKRAQINEDVVFSDSDGVDGYMCDSCFASFKNEIPATVFTYEKKCKTLFSTDPILETNIICGICIEYLSASLQDDIHDTYIDESDMDGSIDINQRLDNSLIDAEIAITG